MLRPKTVAFVIAIAIVGACELAHAQPKLVLEVDSDAPEIISRDAIAERVATELAGATAVTITIRYRDADRSLVVRATRDDGRSVERKVTAEGDAAAVQREAVLLAGNVARDEARELLDALAARPPKPKPEEPKPETPVEEPTPEPKKAPPPPPEEIRFANVGIVYPIATNFGHPAITTYFDLSFGLGLVGKVKGLQLGAAVVGAREIRGVELSPINYAGDVEGVQLGVINVARRVKGAQIGVINVAEEVDGGAIGVISIHRDAFHVAAWGGNLAYLNAALVWESKWAYTLVGMTYGTLETQLEPRVGTVAAAGLRARVVAGLDVGLESAFSSIDPITGDKGSNVWFHERAIVGYRVNSWLRPFAGGGFRAPISIIEGSHAFRPDFIGGVEF